MNQAARDVEGKTNIEEGEGDVLDIMITQYQINKTAFH